MSNEYDKDDKANQSQPLKIASKAPEEARPLSTIRVFQSEPALPATQQAQWQFGDWNSLARLSLQDIEHVEAKTQMALITAAAQLQLGNTDLAKQLIYQARQWGAPQGLCIRILASSAYNTLGKARLILNDTDLATNHFKISVALSTPGTDTQLITPMRLAHQAMQLGITPDQISNWSLLLAQSQQTDTAITDASKASPVIQSLQAKLGQLLQQVVSQSFDMSLDGIAVFEQKDPFLPGKLALALAYWITEHPASDARTLERCQAFHKISSWTQEIRSQTWGIDFYLRALCKLKQANLLEKCLSNEELSTLKKQLDWRSFVDKETYVLKNRPNNFYGVAYSIAYHRYELGWEEAKYSDALLDKIVNHYQTSAGEFGFADETEGKGRYDRYSFLLITEIAHRFRESGLPLSTRLKRLLKNSADYVLINLNKDGNGFQYGRSIGAYGDTAFMEILSAAAWFNVLDSQEQAMAYHFCCLTTEKFLNYWWDSERGSVNLWEEGRTTEAYRGKHRILGENFSLIHQHIYTHQVWERLGFIPADCDDNVFCGWLTTLPKASLTWFHKGQQDDNQQAVLTWRDEDIIYTIPLVNGEQYYDYSTYLPTPYTNKGIQGIPDLQIALLVPKIYIKDNKQLMPISNFQNINLQKTEEVYCLTWENKALVEVGKKQPVVWKGISSKSQVFLTPGKIVRQDNFFGELEKIVSIKTEWLNAHDIFINKHHDNLIEFKNSKFGKIIFNGYNEVAINAKVVSFKPKQPSTERVVVSWCLSNSNLVD